MKTSRNNILEKLKGMRSKKNKDNKQATESDYLLVAYTLFQTHIEEYRKKNPNNPGNEIAFYPNDIERWEPADYKNYTDTNPAFNEYYLAAKYLFEIEKSNREFSFKVALTSLISKKIISLSDEDYNNAINDLVNDHENHSVNNPDRKPWNKNKCFSAITDTRKKNEIDKVINQALAAPAELNTDLEKRIIKYDFYTIVESACKQYIDMNTNMSDKRKLDLEIIREIIKDQPKNKADIDAAIKKLKNHFESATFEMGFSSRLADLVNEAVNDFIAKINKMNATVTDDKKKYEITRTLQTKIWTPSPEKKTRTLVLAIPGLNDSVDTFNLLAKEHVKEGRTVLSYDQAGFGFDELRGKGLNIRQMHNDFYSILEDSLKDQRYDEVILIGHSLGGALLANCKTTINNMNAKYSAKENKPKISEIHIPAAAVMEYPKLQGIGSAVSNAINPGDKSDDVKAKRKAFVTREGGVQPVDILKRLGDFIGFVGRAFKNLAEMISEPNYSYSKGPHWHLYYSKNDALVNPSSYESLESRLLISNNQNVSIKEQEGGHHFHYDLTLKDLEKPDDNAHSHRSAGSKNRTR